MAETDKQILETQLKQTSEEASSLRDQVQKLELMIVEANSGSSDVDTLRRELHESQKHAAQLEHVIQFLRGRSEEAQLESKQLEVEFTESQESISSLSRQINEAQLETEDFAKKYLQEQQEKQDLEEELRAIQQQFTDLRKQALEAKKDKELAEEALKNASKSVQALETSVEERRGSFALVEEELNTIKDMLAEGIGQAQEIEKQYLDAIDEKVAAINEAEQLVKQNNQLQEEVRLLKEQISEYHHREQDIQAETGQQVDHLMRQRDSANQRCRDIQQTLEQASKENEILKAGNRELEARASKAERLKGELDMEIKTAHQHLAKKVKETTLLSEQIEDLKLRALELQKSREADRTRLVEVENRLNLEQHNEKRLEEKLAEVRKEAEQQVNKWEEKYFRICEKLQNAEARNKELQGLEERHNQMQALLASLGNFMTKTHTAQPQTPMQIVDTQNPRPRRQNLETMPDLFDNPPEGPRIKKDLFD